MNSSPNKMFVAVDFDGTCVTHCYPSVGADVGAQDVLRLLVASGFDLILYTMRSGKELKDAVSWFESNDIPLFGVNHNSTQSSWTSSPKVYAHMYIDDAAIGTPLIRPENGGRAYVDWMEVLSDLMSMYSAIASTLTDFPELYAKWRMHVIGNYLKADA